MMTFAFRIPLELLFILWLFTQQVEEEEEESEEEDDAFGPKKSKDVESDDPVARKFIFFPSRQWRHNGAERVRFCDS
jgi:hypothetical protein